MEKLDTLVKDIGEKYFDDIEVHVAKVRFASES